MQCKRCKIEIKDENVALNDSVSYIELAEKAKTEDSVRVRLTLCGKCKREFSDLMDSFTLNKPTKTDFKKRLASLVVEGKKGRFVALKALDELIGATKKGK